MGDDQLSESFRTQLVRDMENMRTELAETNKANKHIIDCKKENGCYNGYCCKPCNGASVIFFWVAGEEWCYSTRGRSQDYNYVRCNDDADCDPNWHCAGPCAIA